MQDSDWFRQKLGIHDEVGIEDERVAEATRVGVEWESSGTRVGLEWDSSGTRVGLKWD